jgi:glycosyltransferase involved in cell wall biosynthesis
MNKRIKVIWLCNVAFSDTQAASTGTWLHSMAAALINTGEIELFNITQAKVKDVTRQDHKSIKQWVVPFASIKNNGLPNTKIIRQIQEIVNDIDPDVIHIWGTENYWGLLSARGYIKGNTVLEIQGLKFAYAKYFYSGLSLLDVVKCFGIKEFLKPSVSLVGLKRSFKRWGKFEKEMLLKHKTIATQSDWVRAYVENVSPQAQIVHSDIALRDEFIKADKWEFNNCVPHQIFTSANSSSISYKGLHILLDAIAILKKRYPQVKLCIAGSMQTGLRQDGYSKWLKRKIKQLEIAGNVHWLGSLDAKSIVLQMYKANVVVIPSFIETYCLAFDEALTVGAPTVASFAGAMPELATHKETALFFPPGDAGMCANAIESFIADENYATTISCKAYNEKKTKNNDNIALSQMAIYKKVIGETI